MRSFLSANLYGALLVVLGGLISALSNSLVHGLSVPLPTFQMVFFKTVTSLCLLILYYRKRLKKVMQTKILKIHALKGLFGAIGNFFWFGALIYLPLAQSSSLSLTSALFTSLGGWILFKESFRWPILVSLLLGFLGISFILNPYKGGIHFYAFLPLLSAFFFSASSLTVKVIAQKDSSETTLFYLMLFMCLFSLGPSLLNWRAPSFDDLGRLMIVGGLYTALQLFLIEAYTYAEASYIAPFKFSRFPLNILAGFLLFFEIPQAFTLLGGGLILLSNIMLIYSESQKFRQKGQ
jgi:drug/metabolite transporter (DMT)-like permease